MGKPNGGARELSSWRRIVAQRDLVIVDAIWEPSQCSDKALVLSTSKALRRAGQSLDMTQLLEEQGFLEHLIIRQRNQHRGSVHFRKLIDVQRKVRQGPRPGAWSHRDVQSPGRGDGCFRMCSYGYCQRSRSCHCYKGQPLAAPVTPRCRADNCSTCFFAGPRRSFSFCSRSARASAAARSQTRECSCRAQCRA